MRTTLPEQHPSRRKVLAGGLAGLGALGVTGGLAGCGSPLAAGVAGAPLNPDSVTFWNLFGGGDGARLQTMLDEYRRQQGSQESLTAATFAWGNPYYTKVVLATLGNKPPDVAVAHATRATILAQAGLLEPITEDLLGLAGLSSSSFTPSVWEAGKVGDSYYTIPLDTHPYVLFFNADVCGQAGLLDGDGKLAPIQGREAFEAALTAISQVTGGAAWSASNVGDTSGSWRLFQTLYWQMDGATDFLGDDGQQLTVNEELALETMGYIGDLAARGLLTPTVDYAGASTLLYTGKVGFQTQGEWEITTAQGIEGLTFGMVPIPQVFDAPAAQADSHTFIIPRMERTDAQRELAMGFIKSLLDQSLTWAEGGHVPALRATLESPEYQALEPQADYAAAAEIAKYDPPGWYSGSGSTFETIVGAQIGLVQQQLASPQQALDAIKEQLRTYLDTPSPVLGS
ncbi:extracellular solute-binding protein [Quadrisphaera sp. KR29]|uniref:extracellular solute-binding protein n=1 Tax=Quadrisphaera sp. KR29 TaxID=3461391 RepID=UPI004043DFFA